MADYFDFIGYMNADSDWDSEYERISGLPKCRELALALHDLLTSYDGAPAQYYALYFSLCEEGLASKGEWREVWEQFNRAYDEDTTDYYREYAPLSLE